MAGLIAGLLKGWSFRKACLFGSSAAAINVTQIGPMLAVKSFDQVKDFMDTCLKNDPSLQKLIQENF
jgi:sugar/nucleoside kinase (ribokinase family)